MGTSIETRELIDEYYETINKGDWDAWLTLFDANVMIDEQLAGRVEGVAALRGALDGIKKGYSVFQNIPHHIVINGDEACVISHISAANVIGIPIEANVANYFRLENGRIKYMANFHDTVPFGPFVHQKLD
jgi:ketosteroid isomerase-like protein